MPERIPSSEFQIPNSEFQTRTVLRGEGLAIMAKRNVNVASQVFEVRESRESTVLDAFDVLLGRGVVADGDVMLGLAGVDLIYLRLSALLCGAARVLPRHPGPAPVPVRRRRRRGRSSENRP
jgi:Gas vesicle protein